MDPIRKLFAKTNGVKPALFSFNSDGACPTCNGLGLLCSDRAFLDGVKSVCTDCEGRRYTEEVLALSVNAHADWVVDLGPDGGDEGGLVVFSGPPAELVRAAGSFTGEHLARYVS